MRSLPLILAMAAIGACSAAGAEGPDAFDRHAGPLDPAAQERRSNACLERWRAYRDDGLVQAGGARPLVSVLTWGRLSPAEQQLFVETSACVGSGGQTGAREVVVLDYLGGREIHRAMADNDLAFGE